MNINIKSLIYWNCRRGMRELDLIFSNFIKQRYDYLTFEEKNNFLCMLNYSDYEVFDWLINRYYPANYNIFTIIEIIKKNMTYYRITDDI
uniref:FAD assembly factor SdhE n=1 Tax=Candidatus Aschnera chinzeii TaxID=1485666 RepID=A0AAT9G3V8_9ENTR|nr:MAG: FAD assembly factor SdhE [Candidatus Aschnera chinzeii]